MAYVYRHIRLDKNKPFYIGIGSDKWYRRAFRKGSANKIWNNIVSKTDYEIEILFDNISIDFARIKEIEFIKLYGRKDLGTGSLANMTNGGDGVVGWSEERRMKHINYCKNRPVSDQTRRRQSDAQKGKKQPPEQINKRIQTMRDRGIVITSETREKMASKLRGRPLPDWVKKKLSDAKKGRTIPWYFVPILQFDMDGNFIKEYESIKQAKEGLGLKNIHKSLVGERKHCGGFVWKYKNKTT